ASARTRDSARSRVLEASRTRVPKSGPSACLSLYLRPLNVRSYAACLTSAWIAHSACAYASSAGASAGRGGAGEDCGAVAGVGPTIAASRRRDAHSTTIKASTIRPATSSLGRKNLCGSLGVVVITLATDYILTVTNGTLTTRTPGL